jgi:drug/metabolite transporter (DMT)-like permease
MTRSNVPYLAYVQILAGALLLSTGATVIKSVHFGVLELAGWRAAVIALFLLVAIRPPRICWDRKLIPAALAHGITTLLFMWGNKLTAAATAIFLQYTAPLYLLLLGPWLLKEPFQRRDLGIVGLIGGGMALLLMDPVKTSTHASNPGLGSLVAATCGIAWAFTTLTMRGLSRQPHEGFRRAIAAVILANACLAAGLLPVVGIPVQATVADWGLVAYMGVFQLGCAFILISLGLRRVGAFEGSLLLLVEPLLSPLWAYVIHGEEPGLLVWLGGSLVLLASVLRLRASSHAPMADQPPTAPQRRG